MAQAARCRHTAMEQPSKEVIARLVREGRAAKGYTQQELSEMTGISLRSVQRIENAEVQPRMYTVKILAEHLGFAWEEVVEASPGEAAPATASSAEASPVETSPAAGPASEENSRTNAVAGNPVVQNAVPPIPARRHLNKAQKIILTIGIGLFIALAILAYIAQSARFPETQFELFVLLGVAVIAYGGIVFWIWK